MTSAEYWERRYAAGGRSGAGSYGRLAEFKAAVLNRLVAESGYRSVIEFGCGDGNQLSLATYPEYLGLDVSETAIEACRQRFATDDGKRFQPLANYAGEQAELSLSLDVIYHLIEDAVYAAHLQALFAAATRCVVIYSSDTETVQPKQAHVRHRRFTTWVAEHAPCWRLESRIPNAYPATSFSSFFIYQLTDPTTAGSTRRQA